MREEQMPPPDTLKIEARYGDFFITVDDDLICNSIRQYGEWAQQEIDLLCAFINPGDRIIDAGAYIGTHTRAFSEKVGPSGNVYAFEPTPSTFKILQQNVLAAPQANIALFNIGLSTSTTEMTLQLAEESHNRASASSIQLAGAQSITVQMQALDELDIGPIHFMKVDVEGMELQLLQGAEQTINAHAPIIFLEVNSLHGSQGFLEWATQHGYLAYGINVAAFNEQNHRHSPINIFGNAREVGLLLISMQAVDALAETLHGLNLPRIDSYDDLALLLLHKPQYIAGILGDSAAGTILGLNFPTPSAQRNTELSTLLEAKDSALENASQAYMALRNAFDELEQSRLRADQSAHDATAAYTALRIAFDQKKAELAALYETLQARQKPDEQ
ncbi:FkbM family methyltransferase [Pseudomonas sp. J452]|uniref:FkbM family methyltransferase n=1 Tax=Pseudomonas sp. J452 TaxID=2898441 RepID=UPI0021AD9C1E|nr:FkbM family methyltransferase [Pseudomonas sp. J452]UUY09832.1 FkbM family methyltransferase [Pseudomonas sp. J452]